MNFKLATVLAGLALAAGAAPAMAGDFGYGGSIKDYGGAGGVPVPAPVPIPTLRADYYLRADVGVGFGSSMSASEEGLVYGYDAGGYPVTAPDSWSSSDGTLPMTYGFGVGRYWSDTFRTDLTIEWLRQTKALVAGELTYMNAGGENVRIGMLDETKHEGGVFLANAYLDLKGGEHRRFTPYVGAGLGFALNVLSRGTEIGEEVCNPCTGTLAIDDYSAGRKATVTSLAAAAMVGFAYDLGRSTTLDFGYRYLYVGGSEVGLNIMDSHSTVKLDAQHEHQVRAGLRFDIE